MSELQLGLIVFGILVVVGVYLFNRFQERQLRRRMESKFSERPEDVLMQGDFSRTGGEERIEPRFADIEQASMPAQESATEPVARPADPALVLTGSESARPSAPAGQAPAREAASPIDYVCSVQAESSLPSAAVSEFLQGTAAIGKPVAIMGLNAQSDEWIALPCAPATELAAIRASLQLADRSGPANRVQLSTMRDLTHRLAEQAGASCQCPQIDEAAQAAAEIDRFCAKVDISIGCNLVPSAGTGLPGTKVRGLLESAGFTLESSGRFVLRADDGGMLLSVEDIDGTPWSAERLRSAPVAGLTLTMDVPRVPGGARVFDRMIELGRHLAQALEATVVDDNRVELTEAGIKVIRQQLKTVHAAMEAHGIPAGGALAARLFS